MINHRFFLCEKIILVKDFEFEKLVAYTFKFLKSMHSMVSFHHTCLQVYFTHKILLKITFDVYIQGSLVLFRFWLLDFFLFWRRFKCCNRVRKGKSILIKLNIKLQPKCKKYGTFCKISFTDILQNKKYTKQRF